MTLRDFCFYAVGFTIGYQLAYRRRTVTVEEDYMQLLRRLKSFLGHVIHWSVLTIVMVVAFSACWAIILFGNCCSGPTPDIAASRSAR